MKICHLCLLICFGIHFHSCYGMICYVCETKSDSDVKSDSDAATGKSVPLDYNGSSPPPVNIPAVVVDPEIIIPKIQTQQCKGGDYKSNKWRVEECLSNSQACYKLLGRVLEREDTRGGYFNIERRGCWPNGTHDPILEQGKLGECVELGESKAKLCVCNEMDDIERPCNRGSQGSSVNIYTIITLLFVLYGFHL